MSARKAYRPDDWAPLELRVALSHGPAGQPPALVQPEAQEVSHPHATRVRLTGVLSGTTRMSFGMPDMGQTISLSGSGRLRPLGQAAAEGVLSQPGFILNGRDTGTLSLTAGSDQVTLRFERAVTGGPRSSRGDQFHYDIVG